jgi:hypothetical protein
MPPELALRSIAVTSPPIKIEYTAGEALDLTGLVVTGTYSDETTKTEPVSMDNISGYDPDKTGDQTLTITLSGKTASFGIRVSVPEEPTELTAPNTPANPDNPDNPNQTEALPALTIGEATVAIARDALNAAILNVSITIPCGATPPTSPSQTA